MKTLVLLGGLLVGGVGAAWGQEYEPKYPPPTEPYGSVPKDGVESGQAFKKANIITLHTTDSTAVAYATVARVLLATGYPIDRSDKELGYINTAFSPIKRYTYVQASYRFSIIPHKGGAIIELRGTCKMPAGSIAGVAQGELPIENRGMFGSPILLAWQDMNNLALAYKAKSISYRRQP